MDTKDFKGVSLEHLNNLVSILKDFCEKQTKIHVTINDGRLRVNNAETIIVGVYNHFITVKSYVNKYFETFTIKLVDFQIGKAKILELE